MDDLDALLDARAADDGSDIDSLLESRAATETAPAPPAPAKAPTEADRKAVADYFKPQGLPWYERAAQGLVDPLVGAGQIIQNVVPDKILNAGRKITDPLLNAVLPGKDQDTSKTSTSDFNSMVRREEGAYQGKRADAGQTAEDAPWYQRYDMARIAGTVANPISWIAPEGEVASTVLQTVKAGAKAGAFQALLQPVASEGSFLWDKATQAVVGGAFGGTLGGAIGALRPVFNRAREVFGKIFSTADNQAQAQAATQITEDALRSAQVDPAHVDPVIVGSMRQEVQDALKAGINPDPIVMTNRADAAALPVPIKLLRGEASGDPALHSWEINTAKRQGAGDEILQHKDTNNRLLIENLNALGAKSAPSTFDASTQAIAKIQSIDDDLTSKIKTAYDHVRDSAGRPALMDHEAFQKAAVENLEGSGHFQLSDHLPSKIETAYNAIATGVAPLTVDIAQRLDRTWSGLQREATKAGRDQEALAIGELRRALNDAPISDSLGEQAMQAYKAARALAKQRFDLIKANPAYKAIDEGAKNAEPDNFWKSFLAGAPAAQIASLKQLLGPDLVKTVQDTTVKLLKKRAVGAASDERGDFSQAAYNSMIHDDVMGPRLREIFREDPQRLGQIYRLGRVAENIKKYTPGHRVNTSGTAAEMENIVKEHIKDAAGQGILGLLGAPGRFLGGVINSSREANQRAAERLAVRQSLNPGVTRAPLPPRQPLKLQGRISDLLARGAGAAVPQDTE